MRRGALGGTGPVRQVRGSGRGGSDGIEEEAVRLRTQLFVGGRFPGKGQGGRWVSRGGGEQAWSK